MISLLKVTGRKFNQTMVMITHNPEIAAQADRQIRIEDGKVRSQGGVEQENSGAELENSGVLTERGTMSGRGGDRELFQTKAESQGGAEL